jgi:hypothetical protein
MAISKQTASNVRGDIQLGLSGDKKPGFDPAAAPLETDAEAGGAPMDEEQVEIARHTQRYPNTADRQGSDASAMRLFEPQQEAKRRGNFRLIAVAVIAVVIVLLTWLTLE